MFSDSVSGPKVSSNGEVIGPSIVNGGLEVPGPRAGEAETDRPGSRRNAMAGSPDSQQGSGNLPENGESVEENAPAADAKSKQTELFQDTQEALQSSLGELVASLDQAEKLVGESVQDFDKAAASNNALFDGSEASRKAAKTEMVGVGAKVTEGLEGARRGLAYVCQQFAGLVKANDANSLTDVDATLDKVEVLLGTAHNLVTRLGAATQRCSEVREFVASIREQAGQLKNDEINALADTLDATASGLREGLNNEIDRSVATISETQAQFAELRAELKSTGVNQ